MRVIPYQQSEFTMPWKWRKKRPLHRFILEIPYALYFFVVPSRQVLNEILSAGSAGGGMGTGLTWEPFEITSEEYDEVISAWKQNAQKELLKSQRRKSRYPRYPEFIFDEEILTIPQHLAYLQRAREKYGNHFWKGGGLNNRP